MVSLWSQINSILLWWSESDVWSEGIRQLGAIVGQFRAALKRSFFFLDPDQFECFSHIRVKQSHHFPPCDFNPNQHLCLQWCHAACVLQDWAPGGGGLSTQGRHCLTTAPLFSFPQQDKSRDESKPCEPLVRSLERLQQVFNGEQTAYERSSVSF